MSESTDLEIPVAYCKECDEAGPVIVENIAGEDFDFLAVYCPGCSKVINFQGDVEVKWYTKEELPAACGWRVDDA